MVSGGCQGLLAGYCEILRESDGMLTIDHHLAQISDMARKHAASLYFPHRDTL